jgi:hypothetical protein
VTQAPLWGPGSRGGAVKAPPAPRVRPQRVVWAEVVLKVPPACFDCQARLHATWGDGVAPYTPANRARWKRTEGDAVAWFCTDHKNTRYAAEKKRQKASAR